MSRLLGTLGLVSTAIFTTSFTYPEESRVRPYLECPTSWADEDFTEDNECRIFDVDTPHTVNKREVYKVCGVTHGYLIGNVDHRGLCVDVQNRHIERRCVFDILSTSLAVPTMDGCDRLQITVACIPGKENACERDPTVPWDGIDAAAMSAMRH